MSKKMYLVDYWQKSPVSEYGGLQCVIAESNEECAEIIERETNWMLGWAERSQIAQAVNEALKYELAGDPEVGLVKSFET